ncbi:uncharacterized protein LOC106728510 [Camelus ferus]|uniref:Uncharacterized protein LOC106728510 n=1 Tax=Camelus ferus TaxID=419612 RepID=A0A8B8RJI7_CAMFR|nr:uncharacterized protein LOC106728510 [Camelus ferus]
MAAETGEGRGSGRCARTTAEFLRTHHCGVPAHAPLRSSCARTPAASRFPALRLEATPPGGATNHRFPRSRAPQRPGRRDAQVVIAGVLSVLRPSGHLWSSCRATSGGTVDALLALYNPVLLTVVTMLDITRPGLAHLRTGRSGIAGSYDSSVFYFLRNGHIVSHGGCISVSDRERPHLRSSINLVQTARPWALSLLLGLDETLGDLGRRTSAVTVRQLHPWAS